MGRFETHDIHLAAFLLLVTDTQPQVVYSRLKCLFVFDDVDNALVLTYHAGHKQLLAPKHLFGALSALESELRRHKTA